MTSVFIGRINLVIKSSATKNCKVIGALGKMNTFVLVNDSLYLLKYRVYGYMSDSYVTLVDNKIIPTSKTVEE